MDFKMTVALMLANAVLNVAERKELAKAKAQNLKSTNARIARRKHTAGKPVAIDEEDDE